MHPDLVGADHLLLDSLIDYAGLFPPAALDLAEAVVEYRNGRESKHAWILGRFICPTSRLEQLGGNLQKTMLSGEPPWEISAVMVEDPSAIHHIQTFDRELQLAAKVSAVEFAAPHEVAEAESPDEAFDILNPFVEPIVTKVGDAIPFVEIPVRRPGPAHAIGALSELRQKLRRTIGAKIRCGGLTPDAFPSAEEATSFLIACAAHGVPFKATAGLHHPIRHADSTLGVMRHGFLNLIVADALARIGADEPTVLAAVSETDRGEFTIAPGGVSWREHMIGAGALHRLRSESFIAYGSCSFSEPIEDLVALGVLEA